MKKHLKRQEVPKSWPTKRKGSAFVVRPLSNLKKGLPILVVIRDMLNLAQNRKEVKTAKHMKNILLNGKIVKDERQGMVLFDVLTIVPSRKSYRLILSHKGKFDIEEIKELEANKKIAKIVNKKILNGKKVQLNLSDGRNYLSNIKCKTNDSALINFKENKIEKCLEFKEKANVFIFSGKHAGTQGAIEKLKLERKMVSVKTKEDKLNVLIKQLMVIE